MRRPLLIRLTVLTTLLATASCVPEDRDSRSAASSTARAAPTAVAHAAPLSRALPADSVAYLRLPSFRDWLLEPRRDGLNELKVAAAHQELATALIAGIEENLATYVDPPVATMVSGVLTAVAAPIELVAFAAGGGIPIPGVLARTRLEGYDLERFGALLESLTAAAGLAIAGPLDAEGHALINAGLPLFVHFDEATGVLYLLSGTDASRVSLDAYLAGQYEQQSSLADFERTIDDTGRHLAVWLDVQRWWPLLSFTRPPEELERLKILGVDQAQWLWAGLSSRGGRAAMNLHLEMPLVGARAVLPPPAPAGPIGVGEEIAWAARVAIPTREDVENLLAWIETLEPGTTEFFEEFRSGAEEYLGIDPLRLLDAFGPDLVLVSDAAGFYNANGVRDPAAASELQALLLERGWAETIDRSLAGVPVTEVRYSGSFLLDQELVDALPEPFDTLLPRFGGQSFVVRDGAYQVSASVPQVLADRAARGPRPLGSWLESHDVSWDHTVLGYLVEAENAPRQVYHTYLQLLAFLGSALDVEVDLTRFPTAPDLGMPRAGRLGFQLDATDRYLEARFLYETSPFEALLNTNIMTVYIAGTIAAIAIPAYQEYQVRAAGGDAGGGPDSCIYANDGMCDEPDVCSAGTDTSDCAASEPGNSCIYANDGECDEPDVCEVGTDTADCAAGAPPTGANSCAHANDGECDEPGLCPEGTDTSDCSAVLQGNAAGEAGPDSCPFANDGECDEPQNCNTGTDTTDCNADPPVPDSCAWANDGECDEPDSCRTGTDTTDCVGTRI